MNIKGCGGVGVAWSVHELINKGGKGHGFFSNLTLGLFGEFRLETTFLLLKFPPMVTSRLTLYLIKGFLYEIFNDFGRKIR